jgi:hypothetical protein
MRTVRPNRNLTDVLLLHDNAQPHTGLRTREAIAKMWCSVLPRPAHSPDLAPSDCLLFGPVNDALPGRHFADGSELKQTLRDVIQFLYGCFYFGHPVYFSYIRWKCVWMKFAFVRAWGQNKLTKIYLKPKLGIRNSRRLWLSPRTWWPLEESPLFRTNLCSSSRRDEFTTDYRRTAVTSHSHCAPVSVRQQNKWTPRKSMTRSLVRIPSIHT